MDDFQSSTTKVVVDRPRVTLIIQQLRDFRKMHFFRILRNESMIGLAEWDRIIEKSNYLGRFPDKEVTNPFTSKSIIVSGEGKAYYIENGAKTGNIALEGGQLLTTGVPYDICIRIASQLSADVLKDDRS